MPTDTPMQLGMIGLGRMGANLTRRLMRDGHRVVAYDRNPDVTKGLEPITEESVRKFRDVLKKEYEDEKTRIEK